MSQHTNVNVVFDLLKHVPHGFHLFPLLFLVGVLVVGADVAVVPVPAVHVLQGTVQDFQQLLGEAHGPQRDVHHGQGEGVDDGAELKRNVAVRVARIDSHWELQFSLN